MRRSGKRGRRSWANLKDIVPKRTPCLRSAYPEPSPPGTLPACEDVGVLKQVAGIAGCLEAAEALKMLVGDGDINRKLLYLDSREGNFDRVDVKRREECPACGKGRLEMLDSGKATWAGACAGGMQLR